MKKNYLKFLVIIPMLSLVVSGCSLNVKTQKGAGTTSDLGGVFVSTNKGDTWRHMAYMPTISGSPASISSVNVNHLIIDPSDSGAVYLASDDDGLYYTYNVGNGWLRAEGLPKMLVNDIAVDAKDKCTIYAALGNKLYKSIDCNRNWSEIYFDNSANVQVNAVAVDHYDSKNVYLGTSRGEVMKSLDGGTSWRTIQRLDDGVRKIVVNPKDSRIVFVASVKSGLYRFNANTGVSLDELAEYKNKFDGTNWVDLNKELKEFNAGLNFKGLAFCPVDGSMYLATDKVFLRSLDDGQSWSKIKLLTPEAETFINAIAVNPKDQKELYYVTNTTFYRSIDGGETWITKQLTTSRAGSSLLVDFNNPNIVYLGVKKIKN